MGQTFPASFSSPMFLFLLPLFLPFFPSAYYLFLLFFPFFLLSRDFSRENGRRFLPYSLCFSLFSAFPFFPGDLFSEQNFLRNRTFPPPCFFPFFSPPPMVFFFASPGLFSGNEDRFLPYSSPPPPPFSSAFPFFPGTFFPTRTLFFPFPFCSLSPPSPPFFRYSASNYR